MHTDPKSVEFVVLRHEDREGIHYDLMIDTGEALATWKCPRPPESAREANLDCRRIGDHRRAYLDYEGPVSRDRGEVRQHDRGRCTILEQSTARWRVIFQGEKLQGGYELFQAERGLWQLCPTNH